MKGFNLIHAYAVCSNCDWEYGDYEKGDMGKKAQDHVNRTGHFVDVELGYHKRYARVNK